MFWNVNREFPHKAAVVDVALWPVTPPRPQFPRREQFPISGSANAVARFNLGSIEGLGEEVDFGCMRHHRNDLCISHDSGSGPGRRRFESFRPDHFSYGAKLLAAASSRQRNNRPKQNEPLLLLGWAEDLHAGKLRKSIKVRVTGKQDKRML
jgi:hypothetical protein